MDWVLYNTIEFLLILLGEIGACSYVYYFFEIHTKYVGVM